MFFLNQHARYRPVSKQLLSVINMILSVDGNGPA